MRKLVVVVVATVAVAVAACGGSSKATFHSTPARVKLYAPMGCDLVNQADATRLFGHPAHHTRSGIPGLVAASCVWRADTNPNPDAANDVRYLLQVSVHPGEEYYGEKYATKP